MPAPESLHRRGQSKLKKNGGAESPRVAETAPGEGRRISQAQVLVELAKTHATAFFRTPGGEGFVTIRVNEHQETWPVRSRAFHHWLRKLYHDTHRGVPGKQAVTDALAMIEGICTYSGAESRVFLRVAEENGCIFIDLGDETWRVLEVAPSGWSVIEGEDAPVRFWRSSTMRPLPVPVRGGSLGDLQELLNSVEESSFRLIVAWLVKTFIPKGPYPIIIIEGEQGAAKSTTARFLRSLIDPAKAPIRAMPSDERDLIISATNGHVVAYDNLSGLAPSLSDALCRLSTGGGFVSPGVVHPSIGRAPCDPVDDGLPRTGNNAG